jgi:hypothetical protein
MDVDVNQRLIRVLARMALNVLEADMSGPDPAGEKNMNGARGTTQAASGRVSNTIPDGGLLKHDTPAAPPESHFEVTP